VVWFYTYLARSTAAHSHTTTLYIVLYTIHIYIYIYIRSKNVNLSNPFTFYTIKRISSLSDRSRVYPGGLINFDVSSFLRPDERRLVGGGTAYQLHKLICICMHLNGLRRVYTFIIIYMYIIYSYIFAGLPWYVCVCVKSSGILAS